jgi:hypothetical protein
MPVIRILLVPLSCSRLRQQPLSSLRDQLLSIPPLEAVPLYTSYAQRSSSGEPKMKGRPQGGLFTSASASRPRPPLSSRRTKWVHAYTGRHPYGLVPAPDAR